MKNSFYQLTDTETGRRYLKQMLDFIDKLRQSYKDDWEDLSDYLQGDMPPYNSIGENIPGSSIKIPKLKEFTDNHVRAQWKAMGDTGFKKLNQATGHYTYHEYNSFKKRMQLVISARNKLAKFEFERIRMLNRTSGNTELLNQEGIKYTEALFILLGLDADILNNHRAWLEFTMLGYDRPIGDELFKDWLITYTREAKLLSRSSDMQKPLLPANEFINWATSHKLLIDLGSRVLSSENELILFKSLIEKRLITPDSEINKIWQWNGSDNQRTYLAKQLKIKTRLFGDKCHKELSAYLGVNDKSISANLSDPKKSNLRQPIDEIIKTLINKG